MTQKQNKLLTPPLFLSNSAGRKPGKGGAAVMLNNTGHFFPSLERFFIGIKFGTATCYRFSNSPHKSVLFYSTIRSLTNGMNRFK